MNDFDTLDPYDIPDDPRPESQITVNELTPFGAMIYKKSMIDLLTETRRKAMKVLTEQENRWIGYGDNASFDILIRFVIDNKKIIGGVVKNANIPSRDDDRYYDAHYWVSTINAFIRRSRYAITKYEQSIKRLEKENK